MIDPELVRPGDVIICDLVPSFEAEAPLFVVSCVSDTIVSFPAVSSIVYHILALYMVPGAPRLQHIYLNMTDIHDYRWVVRTSDSDSKRRYDRP